MVQKIWNDRTYFVWEKVDASKLDGVAVGMLEQNRIAGMLPFRMQHIDGESDFRYEIREGISLNQWLEKIHGKKEVMQLLGSIIALEEETEYFLLESSHLYTEKSSVVIYDNQCYLAYIPLIDYEDGNCIGLVRDILFNLRYSMDEDYTYVFELMNGMGGDVINNLRDLKKWLKKLEDSGLTTELQSRFPDTMPIQLPESNKEEKEQKSNEKKDEKDKKGIFAFLKKEDKPSVAAVEQKPVGYVAREMPIEKVHFADEEDLYDETNILAVNEEKGVLIRSSTGETWPLARGALLLGSGRQAVDICISDNRAISRTHAKIYESEEGWCLEDLGSTNGSYINGERIAAGESCRLYRSDRIMLANEEFVFG